MATLTNANANTIPAADHSPRHSIAADNLNDNNLVSSPQSRLTAGKQVSSPWTQIVRGAESESSNNASTAAEQAAAVLVSEEESVESENNVSKRPVWNKPSTASNNGPVEIGSVMGADSWPALSESAARVSSLTKTTSDSLKGLLSDGSSSSVSVLQGTGTASSSSQKQVSNSANPNSTPNHTAPSRTRSMKRSGANTASNGATPQSPGSQSTVGEGHLNNSSSGEHGQRSFQSRSSNDHPQQQRHSFRNRNGGPHSRGDGSHHHSYGGRRNDQDRANQDWNTHRNFNRDGGHVQPSPRVAPRLMRHPPPPATTPFIATPPVRPFGPMGFPDMGSPLYYVAPHPDSMRGVPFIAAPIPPHAVFFSSEPQLHIKILHQIDYYFSNENLVKDIYLRKNMDDQGWVPVKLIASFKKVSLLTDNIQLILDAIRNSSVVEVQGEKVRKRNDWMRWIMTTPVQYPDVSSPQSGVMSGHDMLAAHVQGISLGERTTVHSNARSQADVCTEAFLGRSSSGDLNNESQISSSKGRDEIRFHGNIDPPTSARN